MKPTKVELEKELNDLQQQYEKELDAIFSKLYAAIDKISNPSTEVPGPVPMPADVPTPLAAPTKKPWPGIIGGVKNLWKHVTQPNFLQRITRPVRRAWYDDPTREHLTLSGYLVLQEIINNSLDNCFIITEEVHPDVQKAFDTARQEIKQLLQSYFVRTHKLSLALGDTIATDKFMHPPKQQFFPGFEKEPPKKIVLGEPQKPKTEPDGILPPDEPDTTLLDEPDIGPEPDTTLLDEPESKQKKTKKNKETIVIPEEAVAQQSEIIKSKIPPGRFEELEPFKPWTWFKWASRPKGGSKNQLPEKVKEVLLSQWEKQAGRKFTSDLDGLTNLFSAFRNGWFPSVDYKSTPTVAKIVGNLLGIGKVEGAPLWKQYLKVGNWSDAAADGYLAEYASKLPHANKTKDKDAEEPQEPSQIPPLKMPPEAAMAYDF